MTCICSLILFLLLLTILCPEQPLCSALFSLRQGSLNISTCVLADQGMKEQIQTKYPLYEKAVEIRSSQRV